MAKIILTQEIHLVDYPIGIMDELEIKKQAMELEYAVRTALEETAKGYSNINSNYDIRIWTTERINNAKTTNTARTTREGSSFKIWICGEQ